MSKNKNTKSENTKSENTKSENTKSENTKSVKAGKGTRGRKPLEIKKPKSGKFTVADVIAANPTKDGVICRATADRAIRGWLKAKEALKTKETLATGDVGKPATIYQFAWAAAKAKAAKSAPKSDLASAPAVDVVPAPVAESVAAPVETAVAEPVAA